MIKKTQNTDDVTGLMCTSNNTTKRGKMMVLTKFHANIRLHWRNVFGIAIKKRDARHKEGY